MRCFFRNLLLFGFLMLAAGLLSAQPEQAALGIVRIQSIPFDGPTAENPAEALYSLVEVSSPQSWAGRENFRLTVDGQAAPFALVSDSAGSASFRLYAGEPGTKTLGVTATLDGKTLRAEKQFNVVAAPTLRLLDHVDTELLFEDQPLRFVAYYVKDPEIRVNGSLMEPQSAPLEGFEGVTILTIQPNLDPDRNRIEFSAEDATGNRVVHNVTLYLAQSGVLSKGDKFSVVYGEPRPKPGPFYRVHGDGEFLANAGSPRSRIALTVALDKNASGQLPWIGSQTFLAFPFKAKKEGLGELQYAVKGHFSELEKTEKRVNLKVIP
ncbi:hypothetical protein ACOBR2_20080 [Telmatobacter bradus]|uniref:hypothetical protein n=1 Tax=Telmatobacter bradus TaxID=474953 RepID=UPI003B43178A